VSGPLITIADFVKNEENETLSREKSDN